MEFRYVVDQKNYWGATSRGAGAGGADTDCLGLGDLYDRCKKVCFNSLVGSGVSDFVAEGVGQEFPIRKVIPVSNLLDVYEVEGCGGVAIVDDRHISISIFIDWVPCRGAVCVNFSSALLGSNDAVFEGGCGRVQG